MTHLVGPLSSAVTIVSRALCTDCWADALTSSDTKITSTMMPKGRRDGVIVPIHATIPARNHRVNERNICRTVLGWFSAARRQEPPGVAFAYKCELPGP